MKTRKTKPNRRRDSILDRFVVLITTLIGTVTSILLLIFLQRKSNKRPIVHSEAKEEELEGSSRQVAPDDDPHIFNLRTLGYFTVALIGLVAFVLVIGALLSGTYLSGGSLITTPAPTLLPPEPRLEAYPGQNFPAVHATQEAQLNSYGWVSREEGVVHIPIERAMELIAQSHLPVMTGTPVSTPSAP